MSRLFESGGQSFSFRASASASVLPTNIQGLFPLGLTGLISSRSKGLSRVFSSTTVWKYQFFTLCLFYGPMLTSVHDYWKNHSFNYTNLTYQENWIDHFVSEQTKCLPWLDRFLVSLLRSKRLLLNESVCTVSSIETCWLAEKMSPELKNNLQDVIKIINDIEVHTLNSIYSCSSVRWTQSTHIFSYTQKWDYFER